VKDRLALWAWHRSDDGAAWRLMEDRARSARAAINRQEARVRYVNRAVPALLYVEDRLQQLTTRATFIRNAVEDLKKQFDGEMRELESQRQFALRRASIGANPRATIAQINEEFAAKRKTLAQRYEPDANGYVEDLQRIKTELDGLLEQRKRLLANAPSGME
jgi:hypothetical protein